MITWAVHVRSTITGSCNGSLYQNEVKCLAFNMEIIFHSHANKTHFLKKGCARGLILKVKVLGTQKWPIEQTEKMLQNTEANA